MNLTDLVSLVLRANKAGRPPAEPWEGTEDTTEADAKRFISQLARMLPQHATSIHNLAFPPTVRVQVWCEAFGCSYAQIANVMRSELYSVPKLTIHTGLCPNCGDALSHAEVHPFVYVHPNLFDVWTVEAPSLEAAEEKFRATWDERTAEGGECSHLTSSNFEQGNVQPQDEYEAP